MPDIFAYLTPQQLLSLSKIERIDEKFQFGKELQGKLEYQEASKSNNALDIAAWIEDGLQSHDTQRPILGVDGRSNIARCSLGSDKLFSVTLRPSTEAKYVSSLADFPIEPGKPGKMEGFKQRLINCCQSDFYNLLNGESTAQGLTPLSPSDEACVYLWKYSTLINALYKRNLTWHNDNVPNKTTPAPPSLPVWQMNPPTDEKTCEAYFTAAHTGIVSGLLHNP